MPTQGMADIVNEFAHVTGLAAGAVSRIHARDVGGGFGVRNEIYPEFAALAFAAREPRPPGEMGRHARRVDRERPPGARRHA